MRLTGIHLHAIKPYPTDIKINFDEIPGQVIAIVGENGSGKTRFVESWPGAMYRKAPTHGALAPWAAAQDSFVEASFVNGAPWTARQCLNAVNGKSEAQLLDGEGKAVLESTKVREFEAWAASHLPAPEVFFNSLFSAQGTNGLLGLPSAERKAVVLRALGVEDLEAKAERARKQKAAVEAQLATQKARIDDELARGVGLVKAAGCDEVTLLEQQEQERWAAQRQAAWCVERLQEQIAQHDAAVTAAERDLAVVKLELESVQTAIAEHERVKAAIETSTKRRQELQGLIDNAKTHKADVEKRLANNRGVLAEADKIRDAEARGKALEAEIAKLEAQLKGIGDAEEARSTVAGDLLQRSKPAQERKRQAEERLQATRKVIGEALAVEQAEVEVKRLEGVLAAAKVKFTECDEVLESLRGKQIVGAEGRIEALRGGLLLVAEGVVEHPVEHSRETLQTDDAIVKAAADMPAMLAAATEARKAALDAERKADQDLAAAQKSARRREAVDAARVQLPLDEQTLALAVAEVDELLTKSAEQEQIEKTYQGQARAARSQKVQHEAALADLGLVALRGKLSYLGTAEARIAELEPQVVQLDAEIARITKDLGEVPADDTPSDPPALSPAKLAVEATEKELSEARSALAVAQQRVTDAQASAAKVAELEAETVQLHTDLSDWQKLADDLGKKGIQALLIDAAGPELSTIANDLLASCFGTRYSVGFETVRLSADGKKEIEDFEIKVIDTKQGRDADGSSFSGGERVILNESLSLAFTVFNCKRNGVSRPTLIRDETGAALSAENSRRYMAMLRRAVDIVGADKLLFVSHNPETWELADNVIKLTPEGVTIQ